VSSRHSIEPISISFKGGDAALHHAFLMRRGIVFAADGSLVATNGSLA